MAPNEEPSTRTITIWGAVASGKTTLLAALGIALGRDTKHWSLKGQDDASQQGLMHLTTGLATYREFPRATMGIDMYRCVLMGDVTHVTPRLWGLRRHRYEESINIHLNLIDTMGEARGQYRDYVIDNLARSHGIVLVFDPVREFEQGHAFDNTFGILVQLAQRMKGIPGGRLPHYVAVCITKFDETRVFRTARELQLLSYDSDQPSFPRVAEEDARDFFIEISGASQSGDARLLPSLLERTFIPSRIKYFATSAIGFYVDPTTEAFDPKDSQNSVLEEGRNPRIRGVVNPINVVEAFLWLGQNVAVVPARYNG